MIESNENLIEPLYNDENYDNNEYYNVDQDNTNTNEGIIGPKLSLNPIFFEPDKFITADFEVEVRNLYPNSRLALVVEIRKSLPGNNYKTLATVHDIFDVPNCNDPHSSCNFQTVTRVFKDVILDLHPIETRDDDPAYNLNVNDLTVFISKSNYISINN